jgi:hypothetical protein
MSAKAAFALALVGCAAMQAAVLGGSEPGSTFPQDGVALAGLVGLVSFGLLAASFVLGLRVSMRPARVSAGEGGLVLEGAGLPRYVASGGIRSALVVLRKHPNGAARPVVELTLEDGDELVVEVETLERADALAAGLGFGPGGKRVEVDLAKPSRRFLHLLYAYVSYQLMTFVLIPFTMLLVFGGGRVATWALSGLTVVLAPAFLVVFELVKRWLAAPTAFVGRDGIFVRRRMKTIYLGPATGERAAAPHADPLLVFAGMGIDAERRWAVWRRIALGAAVPMLDAVPTAFERGGRALAGWREHLGRSMQDAGYRSAGLAPDVAARVLESSHVTPEQRVGAALALRVAHQDTDRDDRARIRVAADACADAELREALHAIADDDAAAEAKVTRVLSGAGCLGRSARRP